MRFLFLIVLTMYGYSSVAQYYFIDELTQNRVIKNKIKSITASTYKGDTLGKFQSGYFMEFSTIGKLISCLDTSLTRDDNYLKCYYNKKGIADSCIHKIYLGKKLNVVNKTIFNSLGNPILDLAYGPEKLTGKNIYKYNDKELLDTVRYMNEVDNETSLKILKYDNKGLLIETIYNISKLDKNITQGYDRIDRVTYTYNEQGKVYETFRYFDDRNQISNRPNKNQLPSKSVNLYDTNGNCIEFASYSWDGKLGSKTIMTYDVNNNVIEKLTTSEFTKSKTTLKYDDKGNLIEEKHYGQDDFNKPRLVTIYKYEFYE